MRTMSAILRCPIASLAHYLKKCKLDQQSQKGTILILARSLIENIFKQNVFSKRNGRFEGKDIFYQERKRERSLHDQ